MHWAGYLTITNERIFEVCAGDIPGPLICSKMKDPMRFQKLIAATLIGTLWLWSAILPANYAFAQNALPTPDQLDQLLAPVALYPDALLAQVCAASTDPQQILDVDNWLHQNLSLSGQARTDAAQQQGFDPAFIALVNFPQVLDMMAQNIDSYAAIGQAFAANQGMVMDSVQRLRQQAYAAGALENNQYQTVQLQSQGASQVVVIQPANPQVVYVPQYNPQVIYQQPSTAAVVTASLLSFGAGIALGAWINNNTYPWGWGGWGWNWGHRTVIVHNNYWVVNNRYRPPHPSYHYRPPAYHYPVYARPPSNWQNRPYYRPPGSGGRPPGNAPGYRPPATPPARPTPLPANRPAPQQPTQRPPFNASNPPGRPAQRPAPQPTQRPAPQPAPQYKPNPNAGYSKGPGNPQANSGGRVSAFGGGNNAAADRAAINRGQASVASQQKHQGGGNRK
jgi:Protein of unknown function (DUF3300)